MHENVSRNKFREYDTRVSRNFDRAVKVGKWAVVAALSAKLLTGCGDDGDSIPQEAEMYPNGVFMATPVIEAPENPAVIVAATPED